MVTLQDARDRYVAEFSDLYHAPKTRSMCRRALRRFCDRAGVMDLVAVTRQHLLHFMAWLGDTGVTPSTVNADVRFLRAFFNWCVDEELLDDPPTRRVKLLPHVDRDDRDEVLILTLDDLKLLVRWLDRRGKRKWADLVRVVANVGLRINEALHVRARDVDFAARVVYIRCRPTWRTKSRRTKIFPLSRGAIAALQRRVAALGPTDTDALIFPSTAGTAISSRNALRALQLNARRAGLRHASFKALRHTFATFMAPRVSEHALATLLGHSPASGTALVSRHYVHRRLMDISVPTMIE
jgi:integrase